MLSPIARLFWLALNLGLGLLPSLVFFAWVERNMGLPWIPLELEWPMIYLGEKPVWALAAWNSSLFVAFGGVHSLLAQESIQSHLKRWIPVQALRSFYLVVTGVSLWLVMGLWQNTGVVIWALDLGMSLGPETRVIASVLPFWIFMALCGRFIGSLGVLHFFGFKQLWMSSQELTRGFGTPRLVTDGVYSWVRHPGYFFTIAAFVVTPVMSLDRALLVVTCLLYLQVAIPIEERKLITLFGPDYERYRERVPALWPLKRRLN